MAFRCSIPRMRARASSSAKCKIRPWLFTDQAATKSEHPQIVITGPHIRRKRDSLTRLVEASRTSLLSPLCEIRQKDQIPIEQRHTSKATLSDVSRVWHGCDLPLLAQQSICIASPEDTTVEYSLAWRWSSLMFGETTRIDRVLLYLSIHNTNTAPTSISK